MRFAAPSDHAAHPFEALGHRFVADQHIDPLPVGGDIFQHLHYALDVGSVTLVIVCKAPRSPVNRIPSPIHLLVEGAWLEPAVRIEERDALCLISSNDVILKVRRKGGEVVVAEDWAHRKVGEERELLALHLWHDAEPAPDRTTATGDCGQRVVVSNRVGRITSNFGNFGEVFLADKDGGATSTHMIALGSIPDRF
jgi:hypothetical protein